MHCIVVARWGGVRPVFTNCGDDDGDDDDDDDGDDGDCIVLLPLAGED